MSARSAASSLDTQVTLLRKRMRELLPDRGLHTPSSAAREASSPLRELLRDVPFTLETVLLASRLARALAARPKQAPTSTIPARVLGRRAGVPGLLLRHPFAAAGITVGIGIATYRFARGTGGRIKPNASTRPIGRVYATS